ncbi:MAG: SGNH/GDSL hydrolase family protein [Candidatus Coatesbacteria bacterium]|nr:SGNH/GDSL hydrolase family protein [Candidatus Coatesbacteria bacterium]
MSKLHLNLLALLIGVLLLFALEGALRIAGIPPYSHMMKLLRLTSIVPLTRGLPQPHRQVRPFEPPVFRLHTDSSGVRIYSTSEEQSGLRIHTLSFPAKKGPSTRRIFCFGESSMYGEPYPNNVATLARWMQEFFDRTCEDHKFEVINCGVAGIDSYGIAEFARECLQYEPDTFVVFCGHNERLRRSVAARLAFLRRSRTGHKIRCALASSSRIYAVMARLVTKIAAPAPPEGEEALAALAALSPEQRELQDSVINFEFDCNLQEVADIAREHSVGLVFAAAPPNYRDWPEFRWRFGPDIGRERQRELMTKFWQALCLLDQHKPQDAASALKELIGTAPSLSAFYFWLGRSYEEMGDAALAKKNLFKAIDTASCALPGMTLGLRDTMEKVAARNSAPFVDLFSAFEAHSPNGLVGNNLIMDYCHPSLSAHKIAAKAILQKCQASGLIPPKCSLDRFDEIMAKFTDDDLSWLPSSVSEGQKEYWPRAKPEMTAQAYMSRVAEWFGDYFRATDEFGQSVAWFRKGLELAPDQASLQSKLDEVCRLMSEAAVQSDKSGG